MDAQFQQCLSRMEQWFRALEVSVPPPVKVPYLDHFVFRYREETLEQALIIKLARVVTGLHSARLLLNHGFFQEQIAIHRMLDEFQQDITFLSIARFEQEFTQLHQRYLNAFYEEEFDNPSSPFLSTQKRPSIPRQKIRAFIARKVAEIGAGDASRGAELTRTLSKSYSGYVHAASTQVLNMYGGWPPRFYVDGMCGTPHEVDHRIDLWNYFYRGTLAFHEIALVLKQFALADEVSQYSIFMQRAASKEYMNRAQEKT